MFVHCGGSVDGPGLGSSMAESSPLIVSSGSSDSSSRSEGTGGGVLLVNIFLDLNGEASSSLLLFCPDQRSAGPPPQGLDSMLELPG